MAKRDIKKNDEILNSYGEQFWEQYLSDAQRSKTIHQLRQQRDAALDDQNEEIQKLRKQVQDLEQENKKLQLAKEEVEASLREQWKINSSIPTTHR